MGLFNKFGRQIERFRQDTKEAAAETAAFQCQACQARFHIEHDECPECGAQEVTALPTSDVD